MKQYLNLLEKILNGGIPSDDRTGTGTLSIFGHQERFDLSKSFPLITTKKMWFKGIIHELIWMISGDTNIKYLEDHGVKIWSSWADKYGDLGPIYGEQWRDANMLESYCPEKMDQLHELIINIAKKPYSRRHIVSSWNLGDLPLESISPVENVLSNKMALAPCCTLFQVYIRNDKLSLQLYQRSCDVFLGGPWNIASYALFTVLLAKVTGYEPGEFIWTIGDAHIYKNHIEQVNEQLSRTPYELPTVTVDNIDNLLKWKDPDKVHLHGYTAWPSIKAEVSV